MIKCLIGFACASALWLAVANGQVSTVTGSESTGKITDYTPDSALVLDTESAEPVHYNFARKVSYEHTDGQTSQPLALTNNLRADDHYVTAARHEVVHSGTLAEY